MTTLARRLLPAATLVAASLAWAQATVPGIAQAGASAVKPGGSASPQSRPMAADPELEERVLKIAADLRCLVCQNESIAASRADLANDLRDQVREQLRAGRSEREIREYMVARYGDFVLYTPPVKPTTWLLWAGPFVLLGIALAALGLRVKRRRGQPSVAPLSAAEQQRARALLERDAS